MWRPSETISPPWPLVPSWPGSTPWSPPQTLWRFLALGRWRSWVLPLVSCPPVPDPGMSSENLRVNCSPGEASKVTQSVLSRYCWFCLQSTRSSQPFPFLKLNPKGTQYCNEELSAEAFWWPLAPERHLDFSLPSSRQCSAAAGPAESLPSRRTGWTLRKHELLRITNALNR